MSARHESELMPNPGPFARCAFVRPHHELRQAIASISTLASGKASLEISMRVLAGRGSTQWFEPGRRARGNDSGDGRTQRLIRCHTIDLSPETA